MKKNHDNSQLQLLDKTNESLMVGSKKRSDLFETQKVQKKQSFDSE